MRDPRAWVLIRRGGLVLLVVGLSMCGCQAIKQGLTDHLTRWNMLEQDAVEDPIKAVGGDGIVFLPPGDELPRTFLTHFGAYQERQRTFLTYFGAG